MKSAPIVAPAGPSSCPDDRLRTPRRRTVVVIWQRFGPYHLARLRGAARALGTDWRVVGIEVSERDHYEWERVDSSGIERVVLFPDSEYRSLATRAVYRRMRHVLDELQPWAVCANGWAAAEAVAALKWCRRNQRRAVVMSETFSSSWNPLKSEVRRWRIQQFDAALVGGRLQLNYLASLGYPPQKIEIGYDVVDTDHFATPVASLIPTDRGLAAQRYFFANTRFLRRKGIDALLRAYAHYRTLHAQRSGGQRQAVWHLVIAGSGEMEATWKALASTLGIADAVYWPGFLQYRELPSWYQSAGVFVHPARQEAWGLVVNEAAASRLPVIVGRRVGAASELVRHGENGFIIDPDDIDSFAELLYRVSAMTDGERATMGDASRRIIADFGPDRFGHALKRCVTDDAC